MFGAGSLSVALVGVLLFPSTVIAEPPLSGGRVLRGIRSPALSAVVVSVRPIVEQLPPVRSEDSGKLRVVVQPVSTGPAVTGGSGLARFGVRTFVAQDDSTLLAAITDDGRIEHLRLFDSDEGHDRFHPAIGNKNRKPDLEAIVLVRVSAAFVRRIGGDPGRAKTVPVLILFGSGSVRGPRDRIAVVVPREPLSSSFVRVVTATSLYDRLRATTELTGPAGQLNVEAVAAVDGTAAVRIYNRGNSGPDSVTASVDLSTYDLLEYLAAARADATATFSARLRNPCRYDLGMSDNYAISVGEAIALPSRPELEGAGAILLAGIAEATTNAMDDGKTSGTALGLQLPRSHRLLFTPVMQDGKPASLKIEGLAVQSVSTVGRGRTRRLVMRVLGVVDSDDADPLVPSSLVELEVTVVNTRTPSGSEGPVVKSRS